MRFTALIGLVLVCTASLAAAQQTLKIASLAPEGSPWMREMRAAAAEVEAQTEGRVKFKFYPGGVMGNDATVLRKIRLGQLQGGAFTGSELSLVYRDAQIYSVPFLFEDYDQVDAVRSKVDPLLKEGFERNGFHILGISGVGFAYLMGTRSLRDREDLRRSKVWVPQNDRIAELVFRAGGIEPVPLPLSDVFTALQTGLVDTVGNTTAGAIALQWHTKVQHLFDLPLTYVVGYVALDRKAVKRVSDADLTVLDRVFAAASARIDAGNRRSDAEARAALQDQGITLFKPPAEESDYWKGVGDSVIAQLVAEDAISRPTLDAIRAAMPADSVTSAGGTR